MSVINWPILYINDPLVGRPLFQGKIFVGIPDLDPEDGSGNPINSKQLRVILEDGSKVDVSQPFILSQGGNPVYNGKPVRLDVDGNFSIKILNKLGAQTYYIENAFEGEPLTVDTGVINLPTLQSAIDSTIITDGSSINLKERTTGNGAGAMWDVVLASGVTTNTFDIVQCVGVPTLALVLRLDVDVNVKQLGALGDGVTIESVVLQYGIDLAVLNNIPLHIPEGVYLIDMGIKHETSDAFSSRPTNGITIYGDGIGKTILQADDTLNDSLLSLDGNKDGTVVEPVNSVSQEGNNIHDFTIKGSGQFSANPLSNGLFIRANHRGFYKNIMIREFTQYGLQFGGVTVPTKDDSDTTQNVAFENFHCHENNVHGVSALNSRTSRLKFDTCSFRNNTQDGMRMGYSGLRLINTSFAGNGVAGTETGGFTTIIPATEAISRGLEIIGGEFEDNFNHEVRLDYCDGFFICGGRYGAAKNNVGAGGQRVFSLGKQNDGSLVNGVISGAQVASLGRDNTFSHTVVVFDIGEDVTGLEVLNVPITDKNLIPENRNYQHFAIDPAAKGITKNSLGLSVDHVNPSFAMTTITAADLPNRTGEGTLVTTEDLYTSSGSVIAFDNGDNITVGTFTALRTGYYEFGVFWGLTGFAGAEDELKISILVNGTDEYPIIRRPLSGLSASDVLIEGGTSPLLFLAEDDTVVGTVVVSGDPGKMVDIMRTAPTPCRFYSKSF